MTQFEEEWSWEEFDDEEIINEYKRIHLEKIECIQSYQYERAADLRYKERKFIIENKDILKKEYEELKMGNYFVKKK